MFSARPVFLCLLAALITPTAAVFASSSSVIVQDIYLRPLAAASAAFEPARTKDDLDPHAVHNGLLSPSPRLSQLADTSIILDFPAGTTLRGVALPRVGWGDWAVPAEVGISINGTPLGRFALQSPRLNPVTSRPGALPPIVTADVIDFGREFSVRQLRVTVERVDVVGANRHGVLKVCGYDVAPLRIDLNPVGGVPADSEGVELVLALDAAQPRAGLILDASVYQFRRDAVMRAPLPVLVPGQNRVRVRWEEFVKTDAPALAPISPQHFNAFLVGAAAPGKNETGLTLASWSFIKTPVTASSTMPPPAWEQIPQRTFAANSEGWRPGIPADGFGRFGWLQNSGLLVGSVTLDRFAATAIDGQGNTLNANWNFRFGEAGVPNWNRTTADWVSVRHEVRYDFSSEMRNELAAKAPELLRETRFPQTVTASILAPGFLLDSRDRSLVIESVAALPGQARWSEPRILAPTTKGLRWIDAKESLAGADLAEGWIIAVWPDLEGIPLLLALQKKPASIRTKGASLELVCDGPVGRVGVSYPSGYYTRGAKALGATPTDDALAQRARQLAAILRAYPLSATQEFRTPADATGHVEIRETVRHLEWTNDWSEPARRIAPLPPLVRFAADQGYPVKLPANLLPNFDWPTKTGPYTAVEGNTVTYRLPVPARGTRLYLRPAGPDPLADHVAKEIPASSKPRPTALQIDGLYSWWMQAPGSLAFTLLDAEQQKTFLEGWRTRIDQTLRPNAWFLRKEPFSQAAYPVSFGWIESNTGTIGDLNSGLGAVLYATWAYARCSGDWEFVAQKWPALRGALEYYLVQHDWNNMQTGAREHSGSSAIDMDGIGYQGAIAFASMAEELGRSDERELGRLLVARLGLSTCMRWLGSAWIRSGLPREQWDTIGVGLSEFAGFDTIHARHGGPDHASSEIALTLSWVGQYPELYDLHLRGLGRDFWQWFEQDFVEKKMEDWRKDHPGNRNNHPANITAHLYMRRLLGAPTSELIDELSNQAKWGLEPRGEVASENAALYALIVGGDFPVSLVSWGRAAPLEATYDTARELARLRFRADRPFTLTLDVSAGARPTEIRINGRSVSVPASTPSAPATTRIRLDAPAGESLIEIQFRRDPA